VRRILVVASELLVLSVICVLGAFAAAGIVSLPSEGGYNTVMVYTTCWGGSVCAWLLLWFVIRVYRLRPNWWKTMEGYVKPTAVETAAPLDQSLSKQYGKAIRKQVEAKRKAAKKKASPSSCSWIFNCNHHHNQ
jgi:type VI protein secretion system component VasK